MHLIRGINNINSSHQGVILTIGNFDGVHLGHQRILSELKKHAAKVKAPICVMLFEPHPREKIVRDSYPARLCTLREKITILDSLGVDFVLCQPFTNKFRQLSATSFIEKVLINKLAIQHLMIGDDFRFGCGRQGNIDLLKKYSAENYFTLNQSPTINQNNERISSTRIRKALKNANFTEASQLLGHPYQLTGKVILGQQLGRTLGIPTANLHLNRHSLPIQGVFAAKVNGLSKSYLAVANAGIKPTVKGTHVSLEAHLLDFDGDLYGKRLTLTPLSKIRNEKKFSSLASLKTAILTDIATARQLYNST